MHECKISEKLVELRLQKGITQDNLAKSLSVSNKTISKWETGMSAPSLNMLIALADFYGVSTDTILGRDDNTASSSKNFSDLKRRECISKIFYPLHDITPENMETIASVYEDRKTVFIPKHEALRDTITIVDDFINVYTNNEDLNMSFLLLRNASNFAWMKNEEMQEKIIEILDFLSDKETLNACYFLHSSACSDSFTADYLAENVGISLEKANEILNKLWKFKTCYKRRVFLRDGQRVIFEFNGDGLLLGILSLTYIKADEKRGWGSNCFRSAKMIDG